MQPSYAMPFVIVQLVSELGNYHDTNKDTLNKEMVNDELIVSMIRLLLFTYLYLCRTKSKLLMPMQIDV